MKTILIEDNLNVINCFIEAIKCKNDKNAEWHIIYCINTNSEKATLHEMERKEYNISYCEISNSDGNAVDKLLIELTRIINKPVRLFFDVELFNEKKSVIDYGQYISVKVYEQLKNKNINSNINSVIFYTTSNAGVNYKEFFDDTKLKVKFRPAADSNNVEEFVTFLS